MNGVFFTQLKHMEKGEAIVFAEGKRAVMMGFSTKARACCKGLALAGLISKSTFCTSSS